jgi:hypothetical protein
MGGFFVQGDGDIYRELSHEKLAKCLCEVSIFDSGAELSKITALLGEATHVEDAEARIQTHLRRLRDVGMCDGVSVGQL